MGSKRIRLDLNDREALWVSVALRRYGRGTTWQFDRDRATFERFIVRLDRARGLDPPFEFDDTPNLPSAAAVGDGAGQQ